MNAAVFAARITAISVFLATAMPVFVESGHAADYPARPVSVVVPYAPGSTGETLFRVVARRITELHGTTFVLEAKPGAGGNLGSDVVANAKPDGYTLLSEASALTISPAVYKKLQFDPLTAFAPIALFAKSQMVLVARKSFAANTIPELIKMAKDKPGSLAYGSSGVGTMNQLAGEIFKQAASVDILHVPYKGSSDSLRAVLSGDVQLAVTSNVASQIAAGQIKALATLANSPNPNLPGVPSVVQFLPNFRGTEVWFGILGPAGLPKDIVELMHNYINEAVQSPAVVKLFSDTGYQPVAITIQQFADQMKEEVELYKKIAAAAKISVD